MNIHDPNELKEIYNAVWHGKNQVVNDLLQKGLPVNHLYANGRTLVHVASWFNRAEILQTLLQKGGLPSLEDDTHCTPILLAIESKSFNSFKVLAQTRLQTPEAPFLINVVQGKQTTPLHEMARKNLLDWLVWSKHHNLIDNIGLQDGEGNTLGHVAAQKKNWRLLQWVIQQGLDVTVENSQGQTVSELNRGRTSSYRKQKSKPLSPEDALITNS